MLDSITKNEFERIYNNSHFVMLKNKSVLITGANGLIGSYLIDYLLYLNDNKKYNISIYALSRSVKKLENRFKKTNNLHFIQQDLNEPLNININFDYIIHAASNAHPLAFSNDPVGTMKTNLIGTINLLEMIKGKPDTKFLYISTGEIYGNNVDKPFTENDYGIVDTKVVRSCYPESKRAAETLCIAYSVQYDIHINIARLCYVYGASITSDNSRADAQFLRNALKNEDIVMKSLGLQKRTYCYVADVVNALLTIIEKGTKSEIYNVANKNSIVSVKEYAQTLSDIAGVNLKFEIPSENESRGYSKPANSILDASKLESLGWEPYYDIRTGLFNTLQIKKWSMQNVR